MVIALEEKSVKARKVRKKSRRDFMKCAQTAYIFYNSLTQVNYREHKHFPGTSNMSNTLGPVTLLPWSSCTKLSIKDKKEFWGRGGVQSVAARRVPAATVTRPRMRAIRHGRYQNARHLMEAGRSRTKD